MGLFSNDLKEFGYFERQPDFFQIDAYCTGTVK